MTHVYNFDHVMGSVPLKRLRSVNELGARLIYITGGPEVEPLMTIQSPGRNEILHSYCKLCMFIISIV